jgi:hypothetical protein
MFRLVVGAILIACVLLAALTFAGAQAVKPDDAFILLVYVKHLASDGVIAWNLHDGHVDGCTSFLDLLLKTAALKLTGADPVQIAFWLTLLWHVLSAVVAFFLVERAAADAGRARAVALACLAGLLFASSPSLADGSQYLLETPLSVVMALSLLGTVLLCRRYTGPLLVWLVMAAVFVSWARPEGLALATGSLAAVLFEQRKNLSHKALRGTAGGFALVMAVYFVWRVHYFGYWAPNTYYAKKSELRMNELRDGWHYVTRYAAQPTGLMALLVALLVPLALLSRRWISPRARFRTGVITLASLGSFAVVIISGGDCYAGARFLALPIALAVLGLMMAVAWSTGWLRFALTGAALVLLCVQLAGTLPRIPTEARIISQHWPVQEGSFPCEHLFADRIHQAIPGGSVAQTDFQMLKYFEDDLRVIDLHGLNDRAIAHRPVPEPVRFGKYRPEDAVQADPEAWVMGYRFVQHTPLSAYPLRDLLLNDALQGRFIGYGADSRGSAATQSAIIARYLPASLSVCGRYYNLLVRKDVSSRFANAGFLIGPAEAD